MGYGQYARDGIGGPNRTPIERKGRERTVFGTHANTAHVWAQQSRGQGRSADGRMMFEGATIYSYGTHWPLATFKGKNVVLINADSYSVSTSKHAGHVRGALHGLNVQQVYVPNLKSLLAWQNPHDMRKLKKETHDQMMIGAAVTGNHDQLNAFRAVFEIKSPLPRDLKEWNAKRVAAAKLKSDRTKTREALEYIGKGPLTVDRMLSADIMARTVDSQSNDLRNALKVIDKTSTRLYSACLALAKTKRFPNYVTRASNAIKLLKVQREQFVRMCSAAEIREFRERHMQTLQFMRKQLAQGKGDDLGYGSGRTDVQLWSLAIAENYPDCAEFIGRNIQLEHLAREIAEREPRIPNSWERKKVTLEAWRAGQGESMADIVIGEAVYSANTAWARETFVRRKGDNLETSRGAVVRWTDALRAFQFAQVCRRHAREWKRNGNKFPVGPYQLDRISPTGDIVAGCHTLAFDEMQTCAIRELDGHELAPTFPLPVVMT